MKKMNDFDANGFLAGMFSEQPPVPTTPAATAPEPLTTTRGDGRPDNLGDQAGGPTSIPERTSAAIPAAAIDATAGQVEGLGDLLPADGEWDSLPSPEPCPRCGGIDCWWGLWGTRHCSVCEPAGRRSTKLADRAERLRARARPEKTDSPAAWGCDEKTPHDVRPIGSPSPAAATLEPLAGRQNG